MVKTDNIARKAARKAKLIAGADKFVGPEPVNIVINTELDYIRALNWYNYSCGPKDYVPWVAEYMKKNGFAAKQIADIKSLPDWRISSTAAFICRMLLNGVELSAERKAWAVNKINEVMKYVVPKEDNPAFERTSVADRVKDRVSDLIGDLEEEVDKFLVEYKSNFNPYEWMKANELGAIHAKRIIEYYTPLQAELTNMPDDRGLTKNQLKEYLYFINQIITDAGSIAQVKKAVRKRRKVRLKPVANTVAKLKYAKESTEFKVASIDPVKIVGAQRLYAFNTKYRKLLVFTAADASGLAVKGTTLMNFSEAASFSKTVRKPEEILPAILGAPRVKASEIFTAIRAKSQTPNGRINSDVILLKVF